MSRGHFLNVVDLNKIMFLPMFMRPMINYKQCCTSDNEFS